MGYIRDSIGKDWGLGKSNSPEETTNNKTIKLVMYYLNQRVEMKTLDKTDKDGHTMPALPLKTIKRYAQEVNEILEHLIGFEAPTFEVVEVIRHLVPRGSD